MRKKKGRKKGSTEDPESTKTPYGIVGVYSMSTRQYLRRDNNV